MSLAILWCSRSFFATLVNSQQVHGCAANVLWSIHAIGNSQPYASRTLLNLCCESRVSLTSSDVPYRGCVPGSHYTTPCDCTLHNRSCRNPCAHRHDRSVIVLWNSMLWFGMNPTCTKRSFSAVAATGLCSVTDRHTVLGSARIRPANFFAAIKFSNRFNNSLLSCDQRTLHD